jgi:hypothetical protein
MVATDGSVSECHDLLQAFSAQKSIERDWNADFQEVFARVVDTPVALQRRAADMRSVVTDFKNHSLVRAGAHATRLEIDRPRWRVCAAARRWSREC